MASAVARDLIDRRVPQYLALYVGVSWGVIEFFAFLEDRFLLSPHWTNLMLLLVALLLPSVALFTYFHGRPGADRWARLEKLFIPANVVVTLLVLFTVFSGKDLGAVTTTVTVEDEEGNALERVVPKSEFRKRVAMFPFDSDTTSEDVAWLGQGAHLALMTDLFQDMFLDLRPLPLFRDDLREAGFPKGTGVPRTLKRRIAQDNHVQYFVDGSARRTEEGFALTVGLHDVARGRAIQERTYTGADLLALVDGASVQLRQDLGLPARHIEDTADLPISEILTGSMDALRRYAEGTTSIWVADDYPTGAARLKEAVEFDPTFADAHFSLYQVLLLMGDPASATAALQGAMDHLYRLPERSQFVVKGEWYAMQQDFPKSFAVHEMWAELYPQDIQAQMAAAQMRLFQDDRRGAIEKFEQVLRLDPGRVELHRQIGMLHEALGERDPALRAYERYAAAAPEDKGAYTALAGLRRRGGDHATARGLYEKALLLEPGDVSLMLSVASLDRDVGDFDAALAGIEAALAAAKTAEHRHSALHAFRGYHEYRGAYQQALEYLERALAEAQTFQPPVAQVQIRLLTLDSYVRAGQPDAALQMLESLAAQLAAPPLNALVPLGRIAVYDALERPDDLSRAVAEGQEMLDRMGIKILEQHVIYGRGRMHELRGEWREAIAAYERERASDPTDVTIPAQLGRCHRELGELKRAEELIRETLAARPSDPRAHFELGLTYDRMKRRDDAVRHLRSALEAWAPADPSHKWAGQAREKLTQLGAPAA